MGEAFESTFTSSSRGVRIPISKNISFNYADSEGRFFIIKCEIFGNGYTLINVYFPPLFDGSFLNKIQKILDMSTTGIMIFGDDLNNIFNTNKSSCKESTTTNKLLEFLSTNELQDIWSDAPQWYRLHLLLKC